MTGLEAITEQNGWAMASVGVLIVMVALSALAFAIAQARKVIAFCEVRWERHRKAVHSTAIRNAGC
jgi:hypothetical protein